MDHYQPIAFEGKTLIVQFLGEVEEIIAPKLEDLDDFKPPGGTDFAGTAGWIGIFCILLIIVIVGVYFKKKMGG